VRSIDGNTDVEIAFCTSVDLSASRDVLKHGVAFKASTTPLSEAE